MILIKKRIYSEEQWERHKINAKASYARNQEKIRTRRKEDRKVNSKKYEAYRRDYYHRNPEKYLFMEAKRRAKKLGLSFSITLEDIVIPECCPILDIKLTEVYHKGGAIPSSPSTDRINNSFGYIKGNVRVISWGANSVKSDLSIEQIKNLYKYVIEYEKDKAS